VASSPISPGAAIGPTLAARSPRPIARVTVISRSTGRVMRRATTSPVISASSAASPAAPAMARHSAVRRAWSAPARPLSGKRATARPTCCPWTTMGRLTCGLDACLRKAGDTAVGWPAWSVISTLAPVRVARSTTGARFAPSQLSVRFHTAPAATAIALVRSDRCRLARFATSAAANAAARTASSATAASATPIKASASRRPIGSPREPARPAPGSAIAGQAQAVAAAEDRLHDLRVGGIGLDLAAQVLHVRVNGPLIPLELVPPDPVDQLEPGVHPARHGGKRQQQAPFGRGQVYGRTAHHHGPPWLVDDQFVVAVAGDALLGGRDTGAAPQDRLHAEHQFPWAERLGHVVVGAQLQ